MYNSVFLFIFCVLSCTLDTDIKVYKAHKRLIMLKMHLPNKFCDVWKDEMTRKTFK